MCIAFASESMAGKSTIQLHQYELFKKSYPEPLEFYVKGAFSGLIAANMWANPKVFCLPDRMTPEMLDPMYLIDSTVEEHLKEFPTASLADLLVFELAMTYSCK